MIQGLDYNGVVECLFEPNEVQTDRVVASGESVNLTVGEPFWTATLRVETPTRQSKSVWGAWAAARRGSRNPFLISRSWRLIPRGGPISDTGLTVASVNKGASTVTFSSAGAWAAKIGDMISYYTTAGGYYIGEVLAPATASGGNITVQVWPPPATPHASTARPRRNYAFGEFYLSGRLSRTETKEPDFIEFEARQLIRLAGGAVSPFTPPASGANFAVTESLVF